MECKWIKQKNRRAHKTKELIDTLWNVNKSLALTVSPVFRINRYIMECKSYFFLTFCGWSFELIDTLWNVNVIPGLMYYCLDYELIDTLWNVNPPRERKNTP